jgi:hypothetical protein
MTVFFFHVSSSASFQFPVSLFFKEEFHPPVLTRASTRFSLREVEASPLSPPFAELESVHKSSLLVIPAKAGIQDQLEKLDSRFHGNDKKVVAL